MRYTVTWTPSARDVELTTIWLQAQDQGAVTKASHEIDRKLRTDPEPQDKTSTAIVSWKYGHSLWFSPYTRTTARWKSFKYGTFEPI